MTNTELMNKYYLIRSIDWRFKLDRFEDAALKEILKSVDKARGEIIAELDARGKAKKLTEWSEERLTSLLEETEDLTIGIKARIGEDVDQVVKVVAARSTDEYNDMFSVSGKMPGFNNVSLSAEQMAAMVSTPVGGLLMTDAISDAFDYNLIERAKIDIQTGLLKGESYKKLVDRVDEYYEGARSDVISLVRTQVQEINNQAAKTVANANRDILQDKWTWCGLMDSRACMTCLSLDGQLFDYDDPIAIPYHVRCRCFRLFKTKTWSEITDGRIDIPEFEDAMRPWVLRNGDVNVGGAKIVLAGHMKGTGKDFFNMLSDERKKTIIGANRLRLLNEGKISFDDMVDSRGRVALLNKKRTGLLKPKGKVPVGGTGLDF